MAISIVDTSVEYVHGNNTTFLDYHIPFPFLDPAHIRVALIEGIPFGFIGNWTLLGEGLASVDFTVEAGAPVPAPEMVIRTGDGTEVVIREVTPNGGNYTLVLGSETYLGFRSVYLPKVVKLPLSGFTVTQYPGGFGGAMKTAAPVPNTTGVRIYRETPLTQPTEYQPAGPFPAEASETALDRLTMQLQETSARIASLERNNTHAIVVPGRGNSIQGIKTWSDAGARGTVAPDYDRQLGVEIGSSTLWIGQGTSAGGWMEFRHRAWDQFRVIAPQFPVGSQFNLYAGTVPAESILREVVVAVETPGTNDLQVTVRIGGEVVGDYVLPSGATSVSGPAFLYAPAGWQVRVDTATTDYVPPNALGLDVFVVSDRV